MMKFINCISLRPTYVWITRSDEEIYVFHNIEKKNYGSDSQEMTGNGALYVNGIIRFIYTGSLQT